MLSIQKFKDVTIRLKQKAWRIDLDRWETIYIICGVLPVYEYSLWVNGVVIIERTLFKRRGAKYFTHKKLPDIYVTNKEFKEVYNSNKWIIPMNYKTDEHTFSL